MSDSNHVMGSYLRRPNLTRDQCIEIRALQKHGNLSIKQIAQALQVSERQVRYAINRVDENPRPSSGRPPIISTQQVNELEAYIQSSPAARQMSYLRLAAGPFNHWNRGEGAIRGALERRGYRRCLVRSKSQSGGKVLRWETRRLDIARGTEMTEIDIERIDIERIDTDRREFLARERVMTNENEARNNDYGPREEIDMITRGNGDIGSREELYRISRANENSGQSGEIDMINKGNEESGPREEMDRISSGIRESEKHDKMFQNVEERR